MKDPLFRDSASLVQGDDWLVNLNTGSLDITALTPRLTLQKRKGRTDAGTVDSAKVDGSNLAIVIQRGVTALLDPYSSYVLNISFTDPATGYRITFGTIDLTVEMGVP